eukprot:1799043-Lingulodinium_polyedra.AAC.1
MSRRPRRCRAGHVAGGALPRRRVQPGGQGPCGAACSRRRAGQAPAAAVRRGRRELPADPQSPLRGQPRLAGRGGGAKRQH